MSTRMSRASIRSAPALPTAHAQKAEYRSTGVPRAEPRFCQDTARCGMLVDEERSRSIAGETAMVQPESKPATMEFEPPQSDLLDPNGDGHSVARNAQGD